jgi:alpha-L-fucosidase
MKIRRIGMAVWAAWASIILLRAQDMPPLVKTPPAVMSDFMDQRFGMFIHWGPITLRGTEIGWSREAQVPAGDYDQLYKEFNPVFFDADAWVKLAKDAGMNYLTITSKHHDGFCLWPTKYSDYNIMNSPFKRDVVGELAKACKKYKVKFCIYFTVLDWHDADYGVHNPHTGVVDERADMNKFVARMKNELRELITQYHPYMLWFDGNWEKPWKPAHALEVYRFIKQLDPNVIINNRLASQQKEGGDVPHIGDFDTPEQQLGALSMEGAWETCMTLCSQWAWKPNDGMKSLKECMQNLARSAGGNGNFLFNIGPMMDGRVEARQAARLREMGVWMQAYGESIYTTRGGPYTPTADYATTRKANKIYLHVFNTAAKNLKLPALPLRTISKMYLLKGAAVTYRVEDGGVIAIDLPAQLPDANDSVIVIELNGNALEIPVVKS